MTSSPKVPSHLFPVNPPTRITATLTSDPMGSFGLLLSLLEMESEAVFLCVWLFFFLLNNLSVRWSHVPSGHCWFSFSTLCDTLLLTLCNVVLHSVVRAIGVISRLWCWERSCVCLWLNFVGKAFLLSLYLRADDVYLEIAVTEGRR